MRRRLRVQSPDQLDAALAGGSAGAKGDRATAEVAAAFLKLGLISFGGPIAHIGYFRREFVERRRWLTEEHFAHLLGLCQSLPGPASSQLGFCIGLSRAGWPGALAAFAMFTLPSALMMWLLAVTSGGVAGSGAAAVTHGLKLVAVAVVAHGVLGMARTLTPDGARALIAGAAAAAVAVIRNPGIQLMVVTGGAALGPLLCRQVSAHPGGSFILRYGRAKGSVLLLVFFTLLTLALVVAPVTSPIGQSAGAFFRAGALVFGGGHVVLPLLKQTLVNPGWIDEGTFLAGYGAAQAMPGPLFSVAAFLGERLNGGRGGVIGAAVSVAAIFLPGLLIVAGSLPFWGGLSARTGTARMLAGVNAAVVGLLAAALYDPVWLSAVHDAADVAIAGLGFVLLVSPRWPVWVVVVWCVAATLVRFAVG